MTNRSNLNYSVAAKKGTKRAATQSTSSAQVYHMAQHKLGQFQPTKEFIEFLKAQGTDQKLTVHNTPKHNGVAEHVNHTVGERMRSMLYASGLPKNLWAECAKHAVWLKNQVTTHPLRDKMPYKALYGKKPNLGSLQEWGFKV